jgi:hypothetical protein
MTIIDLKGNQLRIVVEVTHPAHVHFFRNAIAIWQKHGHEVAVTTREKDVTIALLDNYGIPYKVLSRVGKGKAGLIREMIVRDCRLLRFCREFRCDVLTGISGVFAAQVGFLLRKPAIVWDDTEHQKLSHMITYPFASAVYSPDCYTKKLGDKQHFYAGCHELAYLRPEYFTPDADIVRGLGIDVDQKYCVIRFVSWGAHHDVGQHGIETSQKVDFVEQIAKYARPYITSEGPLPDELEKYRLKIPVHHVHHVMAFASLCVGEGATMISESAVLGVPGVYINTLKLGYIDMLEKYGLLDQTTDTAKAMEMSIARLTDEEQKTKANNAKIKLLNEKIDVTKLVVETVEKIKTIG